VNACVFSIAWLLIDSAHWMVADCLCSLYDRLTPAFVALACVCVSALQKSGSDAPVPPDRSLQYTQQYAQAVLDLGQELQLPVVDLYSRLQAVQDWQTVLLKDGLHFTPAGSMAVWQELKAVMDEQLPQLR
jgi:lysophospholipase L1-like esterase